MKKLVNILFLSLAFISAHKAQDQLFKKDNTKILVKITEVGLEEVKYKLFSNLTGPTYVEKKRDIALIIYENGLHEVISGTTTPSPDPPPAYEAPNDVHYHGAPHNSYSKEDSVNYFKYNSNISINFFNFINNELGVMYQREYFKGNFNIQIPFAIGAAQPKITQEVYFPNSDQYTLDRKIFELGLGINYYPSLRTSANYYIGPSFRYMQYEGTQTYHSYLNYKVYTNESVLTRYCFSITNGLMLRTRSRIVLSVYGSLGFKHDEVSSMLVDPVSKQEINPISNDIGLYFWSGFNVGFCF